MTRARTIWEEGHEPGLRVAVLGLALALTGTWLDLTLGGRVSILFDLVFVLLCLIVALAVRPADFFTAGVLPPLLMLGVFAFLALTRPEAIARAGDGAVQAVITGLARHSVALFVGYLACLGCLLVRRRVLERIARRAGRPSPVALTEPPTEEIRSVSELARG